MSRANAQDQKLQAVLLAMGATIDVDGIKGPKTKAVVSAAAEKMGIDHLPAAEQEKAIVAQLKNPKFRKDALDALKKMQQNNDTIATTQWVLAAVGHDTLKMRDMTSGMMNGRMNDATKSALINTEDGKLTAGALASVGIKDDTIRVAGLTHQFTPAAEGVQMASAGPVKPTVVPAALAQASIR